MRRSIRKSPGIGVELATRVRERSTVPAPSASEPRYPVMRWRPSSVSKARISPSCSTMTRVVISSTSSGTGLVRTTVESLRARVVLDDPLQSEDAGRVQPAGERLVEQQDRHLGHQRRTEGDLLLLAGGVAADRAFALARRDRRAREADRRAPSAVRPRRRKAGRRPGGTRGPCAGRAARAGPAGRRIVLRISSSSSSRSSATQAIDQDRAPLG